MTDQGPEEHHPTAEEREAAAEGGEGAPETVPDAYEQALRTGDEADASRTRPADAVPGATPGRTFTRGDGG